MTDRHLSIEQRATKSIRPAEDVLWHLQAAYKEAETLCRAGIIEVAVRNPSVAEYMRHWEGRATKAEAQLGKLAAMILQNDREEVLEWARGVTITMDMGAPKV